MSGWLLNPPCCWGQYREHIQIHTETHTYTHMLIKVVLVVSEGGLFGAEGWGTLLLCFITEADFMEEVKSE